MEDGGHGQQCIGVGLSPSPSPSFFYYAEVMVNIIYNNSSKNIISKNKLIISSKMNFGSKEDRGVVVIRTAVHCIGLCLNSAMRVVFCRIIPTASALLIKK